MNHSPGQFACAILFSLVWVLTAYAEVLHRRRRAGPPRSHEEDDLKEETSLEEGAESMLPKAVSSPEPADTHNNTWRLFAKIGKLESAALLQLRPTLHAWSELGAVLLMFYVCDRTHVLGDGGKTYSRDFFMFLSLSILVASAMSSMHATKVPSLLNRDQTEEWKGWMQILFLLYHYFEAKELYNAIRIFIAGYVWMTGFGNFSYYYVRADFSLGRFAQMMWRLNFFVFFACAALKNDYMVYYICPMHTLFTLFIYGILGVATAANRTNVGVVLKMLACLGGVLLMWDLPGAFHLLWRPLLPLVGYVDPRHPEVDPMHEWFFRSGLDRFVWIYGMACAYCHPACERLLQRMDALPGPRRLMVRSAVVAACLAVGAVWFQEVYSLGKLEYNVLHPVTSWIPLSLWVVLRNLTPGLRTYYLEMFAYLGKITLETYICQFHIWLHSGQANGQPGRLLVLVPGYPLVNFLAATALYIFVSKRAFEFTNVLKNACVPLTDNKLLYNNAAVGGGILVCLYAMGFAMSVSLATTL